MTVENIKWITPETGSSTTSSTYIQGTTVIDGTDTLLIADMTSRELLESILIELKKMNLRQEAVWGEQIENGDVL